MATVAEAGRVRTQGRTRLRRVSTGLIVAGVLVIAYAGVILAWGDPLTWLYAHYEQRALARQLDAETRAWPHAAPPADPAATRSLVARDAHRFAAGLHDGQAFGRLVIGRIGLSVVVVQGTDWANDLSRGPGHYADSAVPGSGHTVAVAGHRTTFGAWFRHIDSIRAGDWIGLRMPYATFHYEVQRHLISNNDDRGTLLRPQGYERLMLSACHPLYSASQRYIVFARAVSVTFPGGRTIAI